ncbi:hypothetical protein PV726_37705 [Streptomyces europaeiscabiei]|uniref:hypothetical protein n=1 Tax=Streptomyces europaeiscabiei TaxID=146819 RepID=UPI0029B97502|nr:hypothetical protein [Streptomyces europaeiscabiei]MDX3695955.1 hypothetical protein [Streptomyces europaeiscabiei]
MTTKQERTSPPTKQQPTSKVESIQGETGTKKSSPATMTMQDWIQRELAKAPPLTQEREKKIKQLLLG